MIGCYSHLLRAGCTHEWYYAPAHTNRHGVMVSSQHEVRNKQVCDKKYGKNKTNVAYVWVEGMPRACALWARVVRIEMQLWSKGSKQNAQCIVQCDVMQCYVMQCYVMQCDVMQCDVMQCYVMRCYVMHQFVMYTTTG